MPNTHNPNPAAGGGKKKRAQVVWDEPTDAECSRSATTPPPKKKVKNVSISVGKSGNTSTRTTYVPVDMSPKKTSREDESTPIDWNHLPSEIDNDWVDEEWTEPEYTRYVNETRVSPKKRRRTASVSSTSLWTGHDSISFGLLGQSPPCMAPSQGRVSHRVYPIRRSWKRNTRGVFHLFES